MQQKMQIRKVLIAQDRNKTITVKIKRLVKATALVHRFLSISLKKKELKKQTKRPIQLDLTRVTV